MKVLLMSLLLVLSLSCFSQQRYPVHVKVVMTTDLLDTFYLTKLGLNTTLDFNPDYRLAVKPYDSIETDIKITGAGFYRIDDGFFGHKIFLKPYDSVRLQLTKRKDFHQNVTNNTFMRTPNVLSAQAKHPGNLSFFDETYKLVKLPVKFGQVENEKPLAYKKRCDSTWAIKMNMLTKYQKKNLVSDTFVRYASKELEADYILSLCTILGYMPKSSIPASFFSVADTLHFNESVFAVSNEEYVEAASVYNYYISNDFNPKNWYSNLANEYRTIQEEHTGLVRDRLSGWSLEDYIDKDYPGFDSLYTSFLLTCENQRIRTEVENKVSSYQMLPKKDTLKKVNWQDVLSYTIVMNSENKKMVLPEVLNQNKLTVIDCWATWCGPCRQEMPYLHRIEEMVKDSVQFLYLSFDKSEEDWRQFFNFKKAEKGNYFVYSSFSSLFSQYFQIKTIPRYILLSKNGEFVIDDKMPYPVMRDDFMSILHKNM